jgi:hypothetical protein
MSPNRTAKTPRRLRLSRETLRSLTSPPKALGTIAETVLGDETSCGEVCTCACETTSY